MNRRRFVATAATVTAVGLAGCSSDTPSGSETTDAESTTVASGTTTDAPATTAAPTAAGDVENSPTAVTKAFYTALVEGNVERANSYAHPESPSSNLPVTEEDVPSQEVTVEGVTRVEQNEGTVAVEISLVLSSEDGTPREIAETVGLRKHEDRWMIWRNDGCERVSC